MVTADSEWNFQALARICIHDASGESSQDDKQWMGAQEEQELAKKKDSFRHTTGKRTADCLLVTDQLTDSLTLFGLKVLFLENEISLLQVDDCSKQKTKRMAGGRGAREMIEEGLFQNQIGWSCC